MGGKMVLSEDEALELVAFLVTAARTQVCLGHPAATQPPGMPTRGRVTWQSLTQWERFSSAGRSARAERGMPS